MSDTSKKTEAVNRRSFMQTAGLGVGAAGAAAFGLGARAGDADAAALEAGSTGESGYRETDHIRTYYKYSRF